VPKLIVKTGTTQDGEYPLDLSLQNFTMREQGLMSSVCQALGSPAYGNEIIGRFLADDGPAVVAVAAVMMQRAGKVPDVDILADAKRAAYVMDYSDLEEKLDKEANDGPPSPSPSESESLGENDAESGTSG